MLNASSDAILGLDRHGTCVFANAATERLLGRPRDAVVGVGAAQFVPQLARAVRALVDGAGTRAVPVDPADDEVELDAVRGDGAVVRVGVRLTPAYTGGRLVAVATVRDLSAARAAASAARASRDDVHELRAVVTALTAAVTDQAIVLADAQGHITTFNPAAERLLGYRAQDVIGRPTLTLSDPVDVAAVRAELGTQAGSDPLLEITRSGLANRQDWVFLTRDGERRPVTVRITAVGDRLDPSGFVCVAVERAPAWEPLTAHRVRPTPGAPSAPAPRTPSGGGDRLLLDLDDAETRALRWQVGGSGYARRR